MSAMKPLPLAALAFAALVAGCATPATPLDQATASAILAKAPAAELAQAAGRIKGLPACPAKEFAPATPLSFLVAAMDAPDSDPERAKALFQLYREAGCDIHAPDQAGLRPIHAAILYRNPSTARFLLESGADPTMRIAAPSRQAGKDGYEFAALVCSKNAARCEALNAVLAQWKAAKGPR